ncbi:hypothetical protein BU23DRAFT_94918 [Bimuria novae-zelandiae CBS 107.79]|uniref:Secreted protein n=1 Tax=Bimuria novae-zelandiae CBS 107.79 TaxID=1447943 RepID=A0A6A5VEZ9_9PLEO|nr:hypothetical protein BU23DRAFT_94918 [Bimuria novae-zelandiae CBS 107.79]
MISLCQSGFGIAISLAGLLRRGCLSQLATFGCQGSCTCRSITRSLALMSEPTVSYLSTQRRALGPTICRYAHRVSPIRATI